MIIANSAKCLKCGDDIYSASRHNFVQCSCGNVFVDGGMSYLRHGFEDRTFYKDTSITITNQRYTALKNAIQWSKDSGRNELGLICAFMRAIRDTEDVKEDEIC
jgi:hypothetical protein